MDHSSLIAVPNVQPEQDPVGRLDPKLKTEALLQMFQIEAGALREDLPSVIKKGNYILNF